MAKRLTDTEIWEQDWFIDLPNKYKLFWCYIKDKCDNAGIWRPNKSLVQRIIGEPLNLDEFLQFVNLGDKRRIDILPSGRWFLREFFVFQYGDKFSATSQVHKGALKQLLANGVHIKDLLGIESGKLKDIDFQQLKEIAYDKDIDRLNVAYGNPSKRVKDKDKNKDNYGSGNNEVSNSKSELEGNVSKSGGSINFSVSGIGKLQVAVAPCEGWQMEELKVFLIHSENEFQTIAMRKPELKKAENFQMMLQDYVGMIQEQGDYKDAKEYRRHFSNCLNKPNNRFAYTLKNGANINSTGMPKIHL